MGPGRGWPQQLHMFFLLPLSKSELFPGQRWGSEDATEAHEAAWCLGSIMTHHHFYHILLDGQSQPTPTQELRNQTPPLDGRIYKIKFQTVVPQEREILDTTTFHTRHQSPTVHLTHVVLFASEETAFNLSFRIIRGYILWMLLLLCLTERSPKEDMALSPLWWHTGESY